MKNRFYSFLALILIVQACTSAPPVEEQSIAAAITQLEKQYRETNDIDDINALLIKYAEYTTTYPEDVDNSSRYLRRSAQIYNSTNEYVKAAGTTVLALKKYYESTHTEANIAALVDYYQKLENTDAAATTMNGYIMAYPNGSKTQEFSNYLGDDKISLVDRLNGLAQQVVTNTGGEPGLNREAVNKFIGVAEIFALTNNTRDTLASDFLFKAGKLAMTIGNLDKALECYTWLYTAMKPSKEAPSALFTHAFTLDNQIGKKDEAKGLYEQFLKDYPDHHFADDCEFQLKNLGKNDAQIIEEFNKKANSK